MPVRTVIRATFVILLFLWGVWGALHSEAFMFLHGVDLLIHEPGHLILGIFGSDILTALGGTLFQLGFPVAFAIYFYRKLQYYASAVVLFWVGQNFFDIAVYMRDARALSLPLIGVGTGDDGNGHDWNFLFSRWGVLAHDITIAKWIEIAGWLCLAASLLLGIIYCNQPDGPQEIDFDKPADSSSDT